MSILKNLSRILNSAAAIPPASAEAAYTRSQRYSPYFNSQGHLVMAFVERDGNGDSVYFEKVVLPEEDHDHEKRYNGDADGMIAVASLATVMAMRKRMAHTGRRHG